MKPLIRPILAAACVAGSLLGTGAHASVVLGNTRVIYPANEREVTVKLQNAGNQPALVQAWVDSGDANAAPENSTAPFTLTPPLMRIEPAKGQTLRLVYTQEPVPADRESVFYLNTLDIPPNLKPSESRNFMQIAFRTRIKVFLRPAGLPGTPGEAADHLKWKLVRDSSGAYALEGSNDSAYHVSLNDVGVVQGGKFVEGEIGMVAPHGTARFVMKDLTALPSGQLEVRYTTINDYGAVVEHPQQKISP